VGGGEKNEILLTQESGTRNSNAVTMTFPMQSYQRRSYSQSHLKADSQSVSQSVSVSQSPLCGRLTRYCFLLKSLRHEFVVLSLWGALSDERPGLSFVRQSQSHSTVSMSLC
jgi:hypothetical protein